MDLNGIDAGLTGRKIIVDSYGGIGRHGGGCFSGKDPAKWIVQVLMLLDGRQSIIVASGIANKCEIQLSYAIGIAKPISINVETFGKSKLDNARIRAIIEKIFDFRKSEIIKRLGLREFSYRKTSAEFLEIKNILGKK